jgi:hypothetical protein
LLVFFFATHGNAIFLPTHKENQKTISNKKKTWSLQRKKGRSWAERRSWEEVARNDPRMELEEKERERQQQTWLQDGAAVAQWAATRIPKRAPASAPASERTQAAAVVAATAMVFPNSLKPPAAAAGSILLMARALLLASPAATAAAAAFATTCCSSIFVVIH